MAILKIAENIYLAGGQGMTSLNDCAVYVVTGERAALIDCGSGEEHGKLMRNLEKTGVRAADIDCVIGTHGHYDHLAGMEKLRGENPGIRLAMHENDADQVESGDPELTCAEWFFDRDMPPARVDERLTGGESFSAGGHAFEVIHTPGHTPGSICLLTETGGKTVLFCGDSVVPGNHRVRSNRQDWENTLDILLGLEFDLMLPGHATQLLGDPFAAALALPFGKAAARAYCRLLMKYFLDPMWAIATFNYSYTTPFMAQLGGRLAGRKR